MTVIVTGAAGFIGSHLAEALLQDGKHVVGIDNFHDYYDPAIKRANVEQVQDAAADSSGTFNLVAGSILDDDALSQLPQEPEHVYHLAAIAGVRNSVEQPVPYTNINVHGTAKLLHHIDATDNFVFASSSSIYGDVDEAALPVSEEQEPDPVAPYALSKVQAEQLVRLHSDIYGLPHTNLRYFSVYGPRQRPDEAFTKFLQLALNDETVPVYGNGEQSRDFTHVHDIVQGTIQAAAQGNGTYNLGSGRRVTVNDMVAALAQHIDLEKTHVEQPDGDAAHTHADISKARRDLGYEPGIDFEDGVASCVNWCRDMHDRGLL